MDVRRTSVHLGPALHRLTVALSCIRSLLSVMGNAESYQLTSRTGLLEVW